MSAGRRLNESTASLLFVAESENGSFCHGRHDPPQFLPFISSISSFQFDIAFQSFMLSPSQPSCKIETVNLAQIPAFSHPNSPYVPWTERNRPTSPLSNYSRSGARAPEPPESLVLYSCSHPAIFRLSQSLKDLRRTMKRNVFYAVRRIKNSFSPRIESPCIISTPIMPQSPTPSLDSANTTSLAAWLSARQRQIAEYDPNVLMTLDEYERAGSWLNVSDGCDHAGCGMHCLDDETTTTERSSQLPL